MYRPIRAAWFTAGALAIAYAAILAALLYWCVIPVSEVLRDMAVAVGWLLAVTLATTQLAASRRENDRTKRADRRASVEVEAFKQVSAASADLTKALSGVLAPFAVAAVTLKSPPLLPNDQTSQRLRVESQQAQVELHRAWAQFVFTIEAYQIALLPFEHLRKFIGFRVYDSADAIGRFAHTIPFSGNEVGVEARSTIASQAQTLWQQVWEIMSFVGDYRVEVMNALTGQLFERPVPRRQPLHPAARTLVEHATKELVAREEEERVREAILAVHEPTNPSEPAG